MVRVAREKFKVRNDVFDDFTNFNLFKVSSKLDFDYEKMSPVAVGKESNVFMVQSSDRYIIIKIYRLETCDFNHLYDYIKSDPRFTGLQRQRRKVIFAWAEREYRNLLKAREAGVSAPAPYLCHYNILVMEMIGDNVPAPMLKDSPPERPEEFFSEIVANIKKFYSAGYVHGDLSHFNILNFNEKPFLIDFSQATPLYNPSSEDLLRRDVENVSNFFFKIGIKPDKERVFNEIVRSSPKSRKS